MSVLEISRVDRRERTYDLAALFPELDGPFTAADIALLPPRSAPNGATTWETVGVTAGVATVLLAGPDADSSGAVVVTGSADLWIRVTDGSETDAAKAGRITLLGGGTVIAPGPVPPVVTVQGRTGAVVLDADDVGAVAAGSGVGGFLSGTLPSPGVNDAALVSAMAGHVGDGSEFDTELRAAFVPPIVVPPALGNDSTDATTGIQAALDAANTAGGGRVFVPAGVYRISARLFIGSNTHLQLAHNATIKLTGLSTNGDVGLVNRADGVTGGFGAASNIRVSGGTWDCNGANYTGGPTVLVWGHASDITLDNFTMKNLAGNFHFVEFNACRRGRVVNVTFDTSLATSGNAEMIQIDSALNSTVAPIAPYDNTNCEDIFVTGCSFRTGRKGIGTHNFPATGTGHRNIRIIGNHFEGLTVSALQTLQWTEWLFEGNTVVDCGQNGTTIWVQRPAAVWDESGIISNNTVVQRTNLSPVGNGIFVDGGTSPADRRISTLIIAGNIFKKATRAGIWVQHAAGVQIIDNVVQDTGQLVTTENGGGIWVYKCTNVRVRGNRVLNSAPTGSNADFADIFIGVGGGSAVDTNTVIVADNVMGKLRFAACQDVIVHDNIYTTRTLNGASQTRLQEHDNMVNSVWTP